MPDFHLPADLMHNAEMIADPVAYARARGCASWLYLNGEEFASMEGGMSFSQVEEAVGAAVNVVSDPPRVLNLDLARQHVEALDRLPRPTLVTCRSGPRGAAVAYMYAGLRSGAEPEDVLEAADRAGAPFKGSEEYRGWVANAMRTLRAEGR